VAEVEHLAQPAVALVGADDATFVRAHAKTVVGVDRRARRDAAPTAVPPAISAVLTTSA
jgi:hypothetical protein